MFEVGKKYITGNYTYECVWVDGDEAIVIEVDTKKNWINRLAYPTNKNNFSHYVEYVEPKVLTTELFVRSDGAEIWLNDGSLSKKFSDNNTIGKIRITHTEGAGLAVEVIG